jgi:hypothetical protein
MSSVTFAITILITIKTFSYASANISWTEDELAFMKEMN